MFGLRCVCQGASSGQPSQSPGGGNVTSASLSSSQVTAVSATIALVTSGGVLSPELCTAAVTATAAVLVASGGNDAGTSSLNTQAASSLLNTLSVVHQQTLRQSITNATSSATRTADIASLVTNIATGVSVGLQLGSPPAVFTTPTVNVSGPVCLCCRLSPRVQSLLHDVCDVCDMCV